MRTHKPNEDDVIMRSQDIIKTFLSRKVKYPKTPEALRESFPSELADLKSLVEPTRSFAIQSHGTQKYGNYPYVAHLDDTLYLAFLFGVNNIELLKATLLHDVIEDTLEDESSVSMHFGENVSKIVDGVSNNPELPREIQTQELNKKLSALDLRNEISIFIVILKVADRVANITRVSSAKKPMLRLARRYHDEAMDFRASVIRGDKSQINEEHITVHSLALATLDLSIEMLSQLLVVEHG
ncbi:HD domain-containing protein [Vibrio crassostreae]|uniref:HD domain-containing protein n=1 Tax=Vibrio crassostreae TaxID=246167 RepID=UPI001B315794|nr:HD domain-containing protein [Vibrio crassostreae]